MSSKIQTGKDILLLIIILFLSDNIHAQNNYIHRLGIEGRPGYIFPTSSFLRGENNMHKRLSFCLLGSFEIFLPATAGQYCRPNIRKFVPRHRIRIFRLRQRQRNRDSYCPLRISGSTYCQTHSPTIAQLRMGIWSLLRLETL